MNGLGLLYQIAAFTTLGLAAVMTMPAVGQLVSLVRLPFALALQSHLQRHGPESFKDKIVSPLVGAVLGAVLGGLVSDLISGERGWVPFAIGFVVLALLASPLIIERVGARHPRRRSFLTRLHFLDRARATRTGFAALITDIDRAIESRRRIDRRVRTVYVVLVAVLLVTGSASIFMNHLIAQRIDEPTTFREYQRIVMIAAIYGCLFGLTQILILIPARQRFTVNRLCRLKQLVNRERTLAHRRGAAHRPSRRMRPGWRRRRPLEN